MDKTTVKAIIVDNKRVLLLKVGSGKSRAGLWELPGGTLNVSEDPIAGLIREVSEETNLSIHDISKIKIKNIHKKEGDVTIHVFLAKTNDQNVELDKKHSAFKWVEITNANKDLDNFFNEELNLIREKL